eukprot:GHRR01001596.1.p1 GENE.GHRR01001596.1~~GHRR01001596.1.p1  ORF type:complete len:233 (+),score=60.18 GHRR01001596.1:294-992(+)
MAATGPVDHIVRPQIAQTEEQFVGRDKPTSTQSVYTYDDMPIGVARIVNGAIRLFQVRTMQEHVDLIKDVLARDVVWDAPPIMTDNSDDLRVAAYLAKSIAYLTLEPAIVKVMPITHNRAVVEIDGTCKVLPKRTWLFPASLLLPREIPIRATIKLGVRGSLETGKIELIDGKWHNLPSFPNFIRGINGLAMGSIPRLLEPAWSHTVKFVGDDYYERKREAEQHGFERKSSD